MSDLSGKTTDHDDFRITAAALTATLGLAAASCSSRSGRMISKFEAKLCKSLT